MDDVLCQLFGTAILRESPSYFKQIRRCESKFCEKSGGVFLRGNGHDHLAEDRNAFEKICLIVRDSAKNPDAKGGRHR